MITYFINSSYAQGKGLKVGSFSTLLSCLPIFLSLRLPFHKEGWNVLRSVYYPHNLQSIIVVEVEHEIFLKFRNQQHAQTMQLWIPKVACAPHLRQVKERCTSLLKDAMKFLCCLWIVLGD